jgi:hypothetical protein
MPIRAFILKTCLFTAVLAHGESVGEYLTQGGRHTRGIDLNLGMLSGVPTGNEKAAGRLGTRFGLSAEMPALKVGGLVAPLNLALLYSTKAVALGPLRWTFSLAQAQFLFHHPVHPRFGFLEPGLLISPNYTFDLILSGAGGNVPAGKSLKRDFSVDAGPALLMNFPVVQGRIYYARNLVPQVAATDLAVSAFGMDVLLPLRFKRKTR